MTVPGTIAPSRPTAIGPDAGARGPHPAPPPPPAVPAASGPGAAARAAAAGALGQERRRPVEAGGLLGDRRHDGRRDVLAVRGVGGPGRGLRRLRVRLLYSRTRCSGMRCSVM